MSEIEKEKPKNKKIIPYAFKLTVPVMFGYLVMGAAFGVIIHTKGYSFIWAFCIALTCYSGSMQFVLAELLATAAPIPSVILITLAVQIRHVFYGLSLIEPFKRAGLKKLPMIFQLTDETYSLQCSLDVPDGMDESNLRLAISALDHAYWITGCTLGALIGALIPFDFEGADFAMTALFVVIFVDQWKSFKNHLPALIGGGCAVVCLLIFGADRFIFPALLAATLILLALRPVFEKSGKEANGNA